MYGRLLVTARFILIMLLIWPWTAPVFVVPALLMMLPSLLFGVWILQHNRIGNFNIRPELKPSAHMITGGPYALVRHPMYVAVLWLDFCVVVLYASITASVLWGLLCLVLDRKAALEETYLRIHFADYEAYAGKVGRFVPLRLPGRDSA